MTILQDREQLVFSSGILRLVGYGLLLMAMVDVLFLLIPVQLMNPIWEFETIGTIIERLPIPLLGFVLVFYGKQSDRAPIEAMLLKTLSWFALAIAICLLLTIPLNINNGFRIYYQQTAQFNTQMVAQKDLLQQYQEQFKSIDTKKDLETILQQQSKEAIKLPDSVNTVELKTDILEKLQTKQQAITSQVNTFKTNKRSTMLKQCLRWILGSLIGAVLFFLIWKSTYWARLEMTTD